MRAKAGWSFNKKVCACGECRYHFSGPGAVPWSPTCFGFLERREWLNSPCEPQPCLLKGTPTLPNALSLFSEALRRVGWTLLDPISLFLFPIFPGS